MRDPGEGLRTVLDGYAKFLRDKELALPKHQPCLVRCMREFLSCAAHHSGHAIRVSVHMVRRTTSNRALAVGRGPGEVREVASGVFAPVQVAN